jgi:hypothetical protein
VAEFQHYAMRDEVLIILRDLVETHGLRLIPEQPRLAEPTLTTYERLVPEVEEKLARFGVVQLEGAFTERPLRFKQRKGGTAAGTYYVDESVGPRLRWMLPAPAVGERPELTPGSIGYLNEYFNADTNEWELASAALKEAFKEVVATMKRHLIAVQLRKGEKIWIGHQAKRLLDEGKVVVDR